MLVTVDSIETLRRYFRGVAERSEHHGQNVSSVIYPLLGLVLLLRNARTPWSPASSGRRSPSPRPNRRPEPMHRSARLRPSVRS